MKPLNIILIIISTFFAGITLTHANSHTDVSMKWKCVKYLGNPDTDPVLIRVSVRNMEWINAINIKFKHGTITANRITKETQYIQRGIEHRWNFNFGQDNRSDSAFIIDVNNVGALYDFSNKAPGTGANPWDLFTCKQE